ncbi:Maf family protein, partial [Desulfovibrio piger]
MNAVPLRPLFVLRPGIRLVLASASPRRRQFMDEWGLPYTVVRPAGVEPRPGHGESPAAYALRAATAKARAVAASADAGADGLILAADTVVALDSDILGKPADDTDALDMLRRLSGRG